MVVQFILLYVTPIDSKLGLTRPAPSLRAPANRKGKGKQRIGAAGKGGVVRAGVPKFHVMITHYEVGVVVVVCLGRWWWWWWWW